jgi:HlyD family secretion protein
VNDQSEQPRSDIQQVLNQERVSSRRRWVKVALILVVLLGLTAAGVQYFSGNNGRQVRYLSAEVTRGDMTVKVTATGTLQPVNQVEVGTEISGTVKSVLVDFNDQVKKGEVLARLDTDQLQAHLRQAEAEKALAQAKVKEAQATVVETTNKRKRAQELGRQGLNTQEERDAAQAAYLRAEASMASARAQVVQAQAQVDSDRTALSKAEIRSPINGIVLKRQIEPGQTVAASLQTPVLFVLAENLAQMELHVAVDEADVGEVKVGQPATFTVDAYPNRVFPATITQVRFAPETVEGVVTYETVLSLDNSELLLRPGMTATADIIVQQLHDALLVPNAALRFSPPSTQAETSRSSGGLLSSLIPHRPHSTNRRETTITPGSRQQVWILRDGQPTAINIKTGATDGRMSQVLEGDVHAGTRVLVDVVSTGK